MCGLTRIFQFILLFSSSLIFSQDYVTEKGNLFELNNGFIIREIQFENSALFSSNLSMEGSERNYILKSREFAFMVNGNPVDGFSGWDLKGTERIEDNQSGSGLKLVLSGQNQLSDLQLEVNYMLYPGLPLVRKMVEICQYR